MRIRTSRGRAQARTSSGVGVGSVGAAGGRGGHAIVVVSGLRAGKPGPASHLLVIAPLSFSHRRIAHAGARGALPRL